VIKQSRAPGPGSGVSNDQTRRHNLSTILTALHHDGSQPRSQLTARTGLNRSTVAALVSELRELGLAFESEPSQTNQVGRPSPMVHAHAGTLGVAVNPELDALTIGLVSFTGKVVDRVRVETPQALSVDEVVRLTATHVERLRADNPDSRIVGMGVAVPGLVRAEDGLVRLAPHLGWADAPIARLLSEATGLPVQAANDASLGAMAETLFGAARGKTDIVYLNGGASGIGGGIIVGGVQVGGADGYAGEFGHIRVNSDAPGSTNPEVGSLETEVNRAALLTALGLTSADGDQFETALLASTDPAVSELVHHQLDYLSTSLRNAVNVLNPQLIVLGGFLGSLFAYDEEFLVQRVERQSLRAPFESVAITRAQLGNDLLMIGAAELAFAGVLADPASL
jgi:predicted NBD/HSP70 family sugar kinase